MTDIEERLKRVDAALVAQLQKSMEKNARLVAKLAIARKALEDIAKEVFTDEIKTKAARMAIAALKEIEP